MLRLASNLKVSIFTGSDQDGQLRWSSFGHEMMEMEAGEEEDLKEEDLWMQ